jgi:hypothetical protein
VVTINLSQQEHAADAQPVHQEVLHAAEPYQLRVCHIVARLSLQYLSLQYLSLQKYELIPKPPTIPLKKCHRLALPVVSVRTQELSKTSAKFLHDSKILPIFAALIIYEYAKTTS